MPRWSCSRRAAGTAILAAASVLACLPWLAARALASADDDSSIELTWGVKIPMRDGIRLNATLYRPRRSAQKVPALFRLNPYTPDSFHREAKDLARHGYAFAAVDVRGRGNSEGSFEPAAHDGRDGADVVEWLASQTWSNGKVGMFGESYLGRAVWSTLKEHPAHLAAAAPLTPGYPLLFWKNILTPDMMPFLLQTAGATINNNIALDDAFWIARYRELYLGHLPLRQFDRLAGLPSAIFQRYLDHPAHDDFWSAIPPRPDDYRRLDLPLLTITGLYDTHTSASLFYFRQHRRYAPPAGRDRHYLVIGPWDHGGITHPRREVGGLSFGPASMVDTQALLREWFDFALAGAPRPAFLRKQVAYYVAGAEEWRYADRLDEVTGVTRKLYLASDGSAADVFHSGRLGPEPPRAGAPRADRWTYDPLDTRPEELDREPVDAWATTQRYALNLYGEGAVYHGEPFAAPAEIAGEPRLSVWIAMDVPDADFVATLYLMTQEGGSILLGEDSLRARYRRSAEGEELVRPGAVERYDFAFPFHARVVPRGSRLRLVVRSPNNIYWEKNYGSGGAVADESGKDARTAHLTLYHDAAHPSALDLPLAR
ncbi:MAG TPA: CocE/NonD family hydrolase [Thermoanaerobaculia bacterium]|nr:CocE/NonD family hydrolase [Thermoanaerobaculia bacterium]